MFNSIFYFILFSEIGRRQASMDLFVPEGVLMTKSEKKKFEKLNKFNFDLQGIDSKYLQIIISIIYFS